MTLSIVLSSLIQAAAFSTSIATGRQHSSLGDQYLGITAISPSRWLFRYILAFLRDGTLPDDRALLAQVESLSLLDWIRIDADSNG